MDQMKISISGTHSTGKSTFLDELKTELRNYRVTIVQDLAVTARDRGFPILRDHTFSSTIWMMAYGISLEQEAGLRSDLVVVDRPVMEPIGYLKAALKSQNRSITKAEDECLHAIARGYAFTYDLLIKTVVDRSIPISSAKERDHDPEFRLSADREIGEVYDRLGCKFVSLHSGDRSKRAEIFKDIQDRLAARHA
jgi:predicted ATPase